MTLRMTERQNRIFSELIANPKRSDRKIAQLANCSQPTVTRNRARLEQGGLISYVGVPKLDAIGYKFIAISKASVVDINKELAEELLASSECLMVLNGVSCWIVLHTHKTYRALVGFSRKHMLYETFLVDTKFDIVKPISFKGLEVTEVEP